MDFKDYSVKNVKTFNGREGIGFNATLYKGKTKIAECIDDAHGGETMIRFYPEHRNEEQILVEHCKGLPPVKLFGTSDELFDITPDMFIEDLINEYQKQKDINKIKKACSTQTLYRLKNQQKGEYYISKQPYDARVKMLLELKHRDNLAEIFNETFANNKVPEVIL